MKYVKYNGYRCRVTKVFQDGYYDLVTVGVTKKHIVEEYLSVHTAVVKPDFAKRMYFFVMYNLSDIHKGIQAGHAAIEYARHFGHTEIFSDFAKYDKTFILLNGGTSNDGTVGMYGMLAEKGSMEELRDKLAEVVEMSRRKVATYRMSFDVVPFGFSEFREPDANRSLTALAFLLDERVWDFKEYPEFLPWCASVGVESKEIVRYNALPPDSPMPEMFQALFDTWKRDVLGSGDEQAGNVNNELRNLIRGRKLA